MNKCRILIVEADEALAQILQTYLEAQGYSVTVATDDRHALTICSEQHPHVILIDVDLGKTSGFSLHTRLKEDPQTTHIHTALLAKRGFDFDFPLAEPKGIFFAPFDFNHLNTFIRECCSAI